MIACPIMLERYTKDRDRGRAEIAGRANHAPTGFCMKELKSRSVLLQPGIMGSPIVSIIMLGSYPVKVVSKLYMGLLKSTGSSIIMESSIQAFWDSAEGSRAPLLMNVGDTIGDSCLTGETIWDCRGNGLFMGGVGGACRRENGLSNAKDFVVGVPPYDEFVDAWPWSESELTDPLLRV